MGLQVIQVRPDDDFLELSRVERISFETPTNRLLELYFPLYVHGSPVTSEAVRTACITEAATRQIAWLKADPTAVWIKVVDDATGDILGAALWHVYDKDPYTPGDDPGDADHGCDWFPEGEDRAFADGLIAQFYTPRMKYMRGPHAFLDILFTSPTARRRGVGNLLVEYGTRLADQHNLPAYIDATKMGRLLYEKHGFQAGPRYEFDIEKLRPLSERMEGVSGMFAPFEWWPMWRAPGGERGKAPWDS